MSPPSTPLRHLIFRGSVLRTAALLTNVVVGFLLMPYVVSRLGDRHFGLWALMASLTGYYSLLDLGVSQAVSRYVAQAIGGGRREDISGVVTNALALLCGLAIVSLLVTGALLAFLPVLAPADILTPARTLLLIVGLEFAVTLPLRAYHGILAANLRFDALSVIEACRSILRAVLIYVLLSRHPAPAVGVLLVAVTTSGASILRYTAILLLVLRLYPESRVSRRQLSADGVRKMFHFSKYVILAQLGDLARFRVGALIISGTLGLARLTMYSIAVRIVDFFVQIITAATGAVRPLFSRYEGAGDLNAIREKYLTALRFSSILSVSLGAAIVLLGREFIIWWMSPDYVQAYPVLVILTVGFTAALAQSVGIGVLQSVEKHNIYALLNILEGTANVLLALLLIVVFKLDIVGAALGAAIPMLISKACFQPVVVCRAIQLPIRRLADALWFPLLFVLGYFAAVSLLLHRLLPLGSFLQQLALFVLLSLPLPLSLYAFVLRQEERSLLRSLIRPGGGV
jgi:O-antigen/teichoic acid export membrane protein